MALNIEFGVAISIDSRGIIEYWNSDNFDLPDDNVISFRFKTETDLYALAKVCQLSLFQLFLLMLNILILTFYRRKQLHVQYLSHH